MMVVEVGVVEVVKTELQVKTTSDTLDTFFLWICQEPPGVTYIYPFRGRKMLIYSSGHSRGSMKVAASAIYH